MTIVSAQDREQQIRERAHRIWLEQGRPEGRAEEHWRAAEAALDEEEAAVTPLTDPTAEPFPVVSPNR